MLNRIPGNNFQWTNTTIDIDENEFDYRSIYQFGSVVWLHFIWPSVYLLIHPVTHYFTIFQYVLIFLKLKLFKQIMTDPSGALSLKMALYSPAAPGQVLFIFFVA